MMYHQIRVYKEECDLQRIVWLWGSNLQEGRLITLPFGLGPSSFIATKCLEALGDPIIEEYPKI